MQLQIDNVAWSVAARTILDAVSFDVRSHEFVGLIGPNGSGKSSLLRTIYRILKPNAGSITLGDTQVWQSSPRALAQRMAVVTQERSSEFDFTVRECVLLGRNPHKGTLERTSLHDQQIVTDALTRVNMQMFADCSFRILSGGEKQRVLIARALAQQPRCLVLDEPTNHLDIRYQMEMLALVKRMQITTIAALHDLNLAAMYCDRLCLIDHGAVIAIGAPAEVLTPEHIEHVYGVRAEVHLNAHTQRPHIMYLRTDEL
ncbi:MAG: ABC transporter ATP-binding protein [Chloroflexales bacterium]|nr:ABC transporter ATP-binding protein [Chloroflexales bacterium]